MNSIHETNQSNVAKTNQHTRVRVKKKKKEKNIDLAMRRCKKRKKKKRNAKKKHPHSRYLQKKKKTNNQRKKKKKKSKIRQFDDLGTPSIHPSPKKTIRGGDKTNRTKEAPKRRTPGNHRQEETKKEHDDRQVLRQGCIRGR